MRRTALAGCTILLMACAPADRQDDPEPALSLADFAGTWNTTTTLAGVENPVESQMVGTADGAWTLNLAGRDPMPLRVSIAGDSLIAVSPEYESILRPGIMVSVRTAGVKQRDMMVGNITATYRTGEAEEVVTGTFQSTRAPR